MKKKTEILKIGNWRGNHPGLPRHYIKRTVKALGIYFGHNDDKENFKQVLRPCSLTLCVTESICINHFISFLFH